MDPMMVGNGPRHRSMYRFLYKRLRLPRPLVHDLMGRWRRRGLGAECEDRRAIAAQIPPGALELDPDQGFKYLEAGRHPVLDRLADRCRQFYDHFRDSGAADEQLARNPSKRFLLGVLSGNEFLAHPDLVVDMVDRSLLDAAARYLGAVPRLEGAVLWWTPPNETSDSSQQWHIDELARRQVKILLNCSDVDQDCGPLHFLPAARSDKLRESLRHRRGRVDEDALMRLVNPDEILRATGPQGSAVMLDSSRCLHFGSRGNRRDRLVLAFHFLPADAPVDTRYHLEPRALDGPLADLDDVQRLALRSGASRAG